MRIEDDSVEIVLAITSYKSHTDIPKNMVYDNITQDGREALYSEYMKEKIEIEKKIEEL